MPRINMFDLILVDAGATPEQPVKIPSEQAGRRRSRLALCLQKTRSFVKDMHRFLTNRPSLFLPVVLLTAILCGISCGGGKEAKAAAPGPMPVKVQTAKDQQ